MRIPELLEKMGAPMSFKKSEPVQFIYDIRKCRQKDEKNLLVLTGQILNEMKLLLDDQ